jgi:hypothetical protein
MEVGAYDDLHMHTTFVDMTSVGTDHDFMTVVLSYHGLRMLPPVDAPSNTSTDRKLKTPINKSDMLALQQALSSQQPHKYAMLGCKLEAFLENDVRPHWDKLEKLNADVPRKLPMLGTKPARTIVDELGAELISLLEASLDIAMHTCTTVPTAPQGPDHYYSRKVSRKRKGIIMAKRAIDRKLRGLARSPNPDSTVAASVARHEDDMAVPPKVKAAGERVNAQLQEYMREHPEATEIGALMAMYDTHNKELAAINKANTKLSEQTEVRKQRALIDAKQLLENKLATGKHQATPKS